MKEIVFDKCGRRNSKQSIPKELLIEKYFHEKKSQYEIAKELGVTQYVVSARMREHGIKTYPRYEKMVRILEEKTKRVNLKVFDNVDHNVAWFLGWLVSDGHISSNSLTFHLSKRDDEMLDKFKKFLEYDGNIYYYQSKLKDKIYEMSTLKINDMKLLSKLRELGIEAKNKKTYPKIISSSIEDINKGFIRGMFEGDGSVIISKDNHVMFEIVGTKELMSAIQEKLIYYLDLKKTKLTQNKRLKNHFLLRYGGTKALKILDWLYSDCDDNHMLRRKFERYVGFKHLMGGEKVKGVILAGGEGTRLRPLTLVTNA